jgi:hypothetical protein
MVTQNFSHITRTLERERFKSYLHNVRDLLKYTDFKNENILPGTLLTQDLKLCHNDYYFLKLDLEKIVTAEIDLDEIYNCVQVKDIVQLLITKHRNVSSQSLHDRTCSVRIK